MKKKTIVRDLEDTLNYATSIKECKRAIKRALIAYKKVYTRDANNSSDSGMYYSLLKIACGSHEERTVLIENYKKESGK